MNKFIKLLKYIRKNIKIRCNKIGSKKRNNKLKCKDFTIISNNCFSGLTYEYLDLPFNSPTIGLYFFSKEYLRFISKLSYYVSRPLEKLDINDSKYKDELIKLGQTDIPLGIIDDVEIVFLHYKSFEEAKLKWEKRCKRINFEKIIYKFCDQNLCSLEDLNEFNKFSADNKICFTSKKYDFPGFIQINKYKNKNYVLDDVFDYHSYFDIVEYINDKFSKKNVFHILLSNKFSGAENVACSIIENVRDEYNCYYCSPSGQIESVLKKKNINYIEIKKINLLELKKIFMKYNPDIIHSHDFKMSFLCSLVKGKSKLICHLHNNYPWLKKMCLKSFAFLIFSFRANKILTVSESIQNEYIFSNLIKKKILCIDNPVDSKSILTRTLNLKKSEKYDICCVARITEQKNPMKFLDVIYKIKSIKNDIKAVWVGDSNPCDGNIKEVVQKKCKDLGLDKNIDFVGFQENPYYYMKQSKIFLLTSDYEGYGLVAFEAMVNGLPCVVSNVGGLPKIVDAKCGYLCSSLDEYVNACNELILNKKLYDNKSKEAINKSKKLDNILIYSNKIKKVYKGED